MKACQVTKQAELRSRLKAQSTEHTIRVELLQAVQKDLVCDEPWVLRFGVQHVRLAQHERRTTVVARFGSWMPCCAMPPVRGVKGAPRADGLQWRTCFCESTQVMLWQEMERRAPDLMRKSIIVVDALADGSEVIVEKVTGTHRPRSRALPRDLQCFEARSAAPVPTEQTLVARRVGCRAIATARLSTRHSVCGTQCMAGCFANPDAVLPELGLGTAEQDVVLQECLVRRA